MFCGLRVVRGGEALDVGHGGTRCPLERVNAALNLRQQMTTLDGRKHYGGELVDVSLRPKFTPPLHPSQAISNRAFPSLESVHKVGPHDRIRLHKLRCEGADLATALAASLLLSGDCTITPGP